MTVLTGLRYLVMAPNTFAVLMLPLLRVLDEPNGFWEPDRTSSPTWQPITDFNDWIAFEFKPTGPLYRKHMLNMKLLTLRASRRAQSSAWLSGPARWPMTPRLPLSVVLGSLGSTVASSSLFAWYFVETFEKHFWRTSLRKTMILALDGTSSPPFEKDPEGPGEAPREGEK